MFFSSGFRGERAPSQTRSNRTLEPFSADLLQSRAGASYRLLFLDERTRKDRPRIKACVIGPPETPSVVISSFLNWQVNQQMNSAFLVFDLVGGNARLKRECQRSRFHPSKI